MSIGTVSRTGPRRSMSSPQRKNTIETETVSLGRVYIPSVGVICIIVGSAIVYHLAHDVHTVNPFFYWHLTPEKRKKANQIR